MIDHVVMAILSLNNLKWTKEKCHMGFQHKVYETPFSLIGTDS
jgi:hypothetical protein